jgi:hypothetical protein
MSERRIFLYSGNVDEAFKELAKKSLIEAKWMPICEISEPMQMLACTGPDRSTCILQHTKFELPAGYRHAIVAERT